MKKLALLFVVAVMLCPAYNRAANTGTENVYTLSVSKQNGGVLSIFNLYGNVTYSETYVNGSNPTDGVRAQLLCYGSGFSRCRVPSDAGYHVPVTTAAAAPAELAKVVNAMIEKSENQFSQGICRGNETKKVMTTTSVSDRNTLGRENSNRKLLIYSSKWNYDQNGNGTMTITLTATNPALLGL